MFNYPIGTVVKAKRILYSKQAQWGHVVGFDRAYNDYGHETILLVRWEDGEKTAIHPGNVETKEEFFSQEK